MERRILALFLILALPGCSCMRKKDKSKKNEMKHHKEMMPRTEHRSMRPVEMAAAMPTSINEVETAMPSMDMPSVDMSTQEMPFMEETDEMMESNFEVPADDMSDMDMSDDFQPEMDMEMTELDEAF